MTRLLPKSARDAIAPAVIAVLGVAELAALQPRGWGYGAALEVTSCILLMWRRSGPLVLATLAAVVMLVMPWVGPQLDEAAVPIMIYVLAVFALARWVPDLRGLLGLGMIAAGIFLDYALVDARSHNWSDVMFVTALLAPPFVFGRLARRLADQSEQLVRQQEVVRREAVRAERDRIARELHDVIAHSVSAMVVQTAAAQDLVRADPERAAQVLDDVAATGRRALAETGRLLHVIRDDRDELGLEPAPGLGQLSELVEDFRDSGLEVTLELDGSLQPLPVGLDVSAYRIVQEALTNALKYAADRTACLRLSRTPTMLLIRATNKTDKTTTAEPGSGLGLVGISERVALFGGSLSHGVSGDGRFELVATLPVTAGGDS